MAIVLSMKDRLKFKIGDVEFILKPLNVYEQGVVSSHRKMDAGKEVEDVLMSAFSYVKYAVKGISGAKMHDGSDYELEFEDNGALVDDCVSEIFTMNLGVEFYHAVQSLRHNHVAQPMTHFGSNKPLEGVSIEVMCGEQGKK